jgi:hypothetical protein
MSAPDEGKDFGRFLLSNAEIRGLTGGNDTSSTLTPDSHAIVLKTLLDRLLKEAEQLESAKQEIIKQIVAVNQSLGITIQDFKVSELKAKKKPY